MFSAIKKYSCYIYYTHRLQFTGGFMDRKHPKFVLRSQLYIMLIVCAGLLLSCISARMSNSKSSVFDRGEIKAAEDAYGQYYYFIPGHANDKTVILVLVHGTPSDMAPMENAYFYIRSWIEFARENNYVLLAPAFNQADFSSRYGDHALSGYRGLFGREIAADEWVIRLAEALQRETGTAGMKIRLYGHSAGGQFVSRFLVMHPEAVDRAVITSAATYPQPDTEFSWPFGLGALHSDIVWDDGSVSTVDVVPDRNLWLEASRIQLTVIAGLNDTAELPEELIPGQKGNNRCAIAGNWVEDMISFAEKHGVDSNFKIEFIPGIGHSMTGLLPYSLRAFQDTQPDL